MIKLSPNAELVLETLATNPVATVTEVSDATGLSEEDCFIAVAELHKKGLIETRNLSH